MVALEKHWDIVDLEIAVDEVLSHSFTLTDRDTGLPVDISAWDIYYKAAASWTADTIAIAPADIVKSNSGLGVLDTFTVPFEATDTDIDAGRYQHDIAVDTGSEELVILKGTLTAYTRQTAVT